MRHRLLQHAAIAALACVALAACVPPPEPTPAPAPVPAPAPAPAPVPSPTPAPPSQGSWMDAPITPGDWRWRKSDTDSIAEYYPPNGMVLFQMSCGRQGVFLSRVAAGGPPLGAAGGTMILRTETMEQTLPANLSGMSLRTLLNARDPILDAMAFSKGRFVIEVPGAPTLNLPSYPEVTRVIEDCR